MAEGLPRTDATGGSDGGPQPGMPRWVKVGIVALLVLIALVVILALAGLHEPRPGGHGL